MAASRDGARVAWKLRSMDARTTALPDLPYTKEIVPAFSSPPYWSGLLGPAKLPKDIKDKVNHEVVRILGMQDVKERMLTQGATPHPMTPPEFDAFIKGEVERLAKVVKASGAKAD